MSQYYLLANHSTIEYVDPSNFFVRETHSQKDDEQRFGHSTAITHIDWMIGDSSWIIPYLIAQNDSGPESQVFGDSFGKWNKTNIALIGDTDPSYDRIQSDYEDISLELYEEAAELDADIPPAREE